MQVHPQAKQEYSYHLRRLQPSSNLLHYKYLTKENDSVTMIQQKINKYHLDKALLNALLTANFGSAGFEIEVHKILLCCRMDTWTMYCLTSQTQAHSEVYILTIPRELTAVRLCPKQASSANVY